MHYLLKFILMLSIGISGITLSQPLPDDPEELYQLAKTFATKKDYQKAFELHSLAMDKGSLKAINAVGVMYIEGLGVPKNHSKGLSLVLDAANKGEVRAQTNMGIEYAFDSPETKIDYAKAKKWYEKAVQQNDPEAQFRLADLYYFGQGVEKDFTKAFELYLNAAQGNYADAQYKLGVIFDTGIGAKEDKAQATEWYEKSAAQNHVLGQYWAGSRRLANKNYEKAKFYFEQAAENNNSNAKVQLGSLYFYGNGVAKDYSKAHTLLSYGVETNNTTSLSILAEMYGKGLGVERNCNKAIELYTKAVEHEYFYGAVKLGELYQKAEGCEHNLETAKKWYTLAAESKLNQTSPILVSVAQYELGMIYMGENDPKNFIKWFTRSANNGHYMANFILGLLYYQGTYVPQSTTRAHDYFLKSAEAGAL